MDYPVLNKAPDTAMAQVNHFVDANGNAVKVTATTPLPVQQGTPPVGGGITYTDKTITSTSGASQTLIASNANRKSLLIKNGAVQAGVSLTGATAAIGGAATITLQPYEPLFLSAADCPTGNITVIAAATNYVSAYEGT